jgi:FAD/FMN-containing dehydrogenase
MLPPPGFRGVFRSDLRARSAYAEAAGIYRILPAAVCLPADPADVALLVRWAGSTRTSLVPRGAGSAMGGGNVGEGVVVDLTRLPVRLEVRPEAGVAFTSANVTLSDLNGAADRHRFRLPPDPSSGRWATLGGMLSTNAAGARSVRYGSVRRWVRAVELVTGEGETVTLRRAAPASPPSQALARFEEEAAPAIRDAAETIGRRFPRTRKNSSGYALDAYLASGDVLDLVIGAEGTLGIVTGIEWQLDPVPAHRAGLRVGLRSLDDLVRVVAALLAQDPSAVELLDRTFLDLVRDSDAGTGLGDAEAVLLVEFERPQAEPLRTAVAAAAEAVRDRAAKVDTALSARAAERLWAVRHAASPILASLPEGRRSLQVIEDACLPLERMGDYIRVVRRAAGVRGIPVVIFGHAGDGHVHVNLLPEVARPGWEETVAGLMEEVSGAVIRLGGTPSGEHGDGRLRASLLSRVYGEEVVDLFRRVKRSFDPLGILAPGVILPSGEPPIGRLKVGTGAATLPDDIAHALRDIERKGGYGRCRMEIAGEVESRAPRSQRPPAAPQPPTLG